MFTPKWKKQAKMLVKGARKFLHYKRDLLAPDRVAEIESRRQDLIAAISSGDVGRVNEASKQLRATCEGALPYEKPQGWFEENVEVMFVAIVIALGLRAYYLQPFRIPTGSMQPTLNGIVGTPLAKEEWPSLPRRAIERVTRGRSYVSVVADRDLVLAVSPGGELGIQDFQHWFFLSRSRLAIANGKPVTLPAPQTQAAELGLARALEIARRNNNVIPAGTVLSEGYVDAGDLVLVDKVSYHFRRPVRGEVFVFDTIGIRGIHERSGEQAAGSHYIKRLCGVPGDTLSIRAPELLIDGKTASEPGIRRVAEGAPPFPADHPGYVPARPERPLPNGRVLRQHLASTTDTMTLAAEAAPGMRQYAALGDNTGSSLDSRYWGEVHEFNLVGPALFSLWPFTTGHWGFIR